MIDELLAKVVTECSLAVAAFILGLFFPQIKLGRGVLVPKTEAPKQDGADHHG